jgi:membrane protein DedA with SNARE-associated domain
MDELSLQFINFFNMLLHKYGPWGLGISMFAESVGIPFASAFFIVTAWTLLEKGKLSIWQIVGIATSGITLGSAISYAAGYYSKKLGIVLWSRVRRRKQHHLTIDYQLPTLPNGKYSIRINRLKKVNSYIKKYGFLSVLFAQIFGFTRTFISFPAGLLEINFWHFLVFTAAGGAIFSFLAILGSMIITKFMNYIVSYSFILFIIVIGVAITGIVLYFRFSSRSNGTFEDDKNVSQTNNEQKNST